MTILGLKFQFRFEHYDLYPKSIFFFLNKTLKRHRFFNFFGKKKKLKLMPFRVSNFQYAFKNQNFKLKPKKKNRRGDEWSTSAHTLRPTTMSESEME